MVSDMRTSFMMSLALALLVGSPTQAQTSKTYAVSQSNGKLVFDAKQIDPPKQEVPAPTTTPLIITLKCSGGAKCSDLHAVLISKDNPTGVAPSSTSNQDANGVRWEFNPELFVAKEDLVLQFSRGDKDKVQAITVTVLPLPVAQQPPAAIPPKTQQSATGDNINALVSFDCSEEMQIVVNSYRNSVYSTDANRATFVVAPNGNVTLSPPPVIDENDEIDVVVVGHRDLLRTLQIQRSSAFQTPGALNILGGDLPPATPATPKSGSLNPCDKTIVALRDFQPGKGEVSISALSAKGAVPTGSFQFGVNALYSGAFSFGAIRTNLRNPTFGLVAKGADSVISIVQDDKPRILYTLTYTPFIWGKRDIEKDSPALNIRRLNPMFGVVLNDISNNFVIGASYDMMSSVYLTAGAHFGRVQTLDTDGGVTLGSTFSAPRSEIPVTKSWHSDWFVGVSLDVRAAVQLLNKAVSLPKT
jgi:hypothetical protein